MIRAIVLALTIATLICLYLDQPKPTPPAPKIVLPVDDYCIIDYRAAFKDEEGGWHHIWTKGWGRCADLDRYEIA